MTWMRKERNHGQRESSTEQLQSLRKGRGKPQTLAKIPGEALQHLMATTRHAMRLWGASRAIGAADTAASLEDS